MNIAYTNWKNDYEAEFEEHRNANYRLIYDYQDGYEYYLNSPDWVMVGDFCNFHRRGTLHIGEQITAKYEALMLNNINIFEGFCEAEFERIRVWHDYDNDFEYAKKIFQYDNMSVRYDDLTTNQKWTFQECLKRHIAEHEEHIKLFKKWDSEKKNW